MDIQRFQVTGYNSLTIPMTLITPPDPIDHLAIIFPGAGYTCDRPLLYYATDICLTRKNMRVLQVHQNYLMIDAWMKTTDDERRLWCASDATAVWNNVRETLNHKLYTLIGKSAGTRCIAGLLEQNIEGISRVVWLTPALQANWGLLGDERFPGLSVIGTDDRWYGKARQYLSTNSLVIDGADHSMEFYGDYERSIDVLAQITKAIDEWLLVM